MKIALTGGIGSGKSFVCKQLAMRGITVYDCDSAAKRLINNDAALQRRLSVAVGEDIFPDGRFDKARLSRFIVASAANALAVDNLVHPAVASDFLASGLDWLESAILFESGFNRRLHIDRIVCITAPLQLRIDRIMRRDNLTQERVEQWINRQMPQEEKCRLADFEIANDGISDLNQQIDKLLAALEIYS
ncbi:MAG: dephospho-CoA kinase [Prevotella sp.]|nr:dephospho-CoA kinase [Prevotella sp.]